MTDSNDIDRNAPASPLFPDEEIAREEARLAELEKEVRRTRARLNRLKADRKTTRARLVKESSVAWGEGPPATPDEKVALFRILFRGREDVYSRLWTNPRKRKKGYAPACENEWVRGVCEKPRIRCGECPNQAFLPMDDRAIRDHLSGKHTIGVYPLLPDETCWFLAVDFDNDGWEEDVTAYAETCRDAGIPVSVERSRSGKGAHVWFFFSEPVSAAEARKLGSCLLTRTSEHRYELSLSSYDRLFPNQDSMPKGGFGNLIALPLQKEPRRRGHTLFLDEHLNPFPDQWAYLASIKRIDIKTVRDVLENRVDEDNILGVRSGETFSRTTQSPPWQRVKERPVREQLHSLPLPQKIEAVLANRLYVPKKELPSPLLNAIRRLAAFQNPEFYKRQRMRLSTALTPRIIACAEDLTEHIALPRGCVSDLSELLEEVGIELILVDHRYAGEELQVAFQGKLQPLQKKAAEDLSAYDTGVLVAPPGAGKTVIGIYLIDQRARNTLILVHRQPLLDQWRNQLSLFLNLDPRDIGQIGGGRNKPNGRLDIGMVQSLVRKGRVNEAISQYGHIIVDECHHVPAVSVESILAEAHARFLTGLTATPNRRDGLHPILHMQVGPTRSVIDAKHAAEESIVHRLIIRETGFTVDPGTEDLGIQDLYRAIGGDEARNTTILDDIIRAVDEGRSPLVLTERKDHLSYLADRLDDFVQNLIVLHGGLPAKKRKDLIETLKNIPADQERLVLATGRYIGEGFDDARLDTLFLAMPVSWKGVLIQYTGRLHRSYSGKKEVLIFDYADRGVPMLDRMFEKRLRAYRSIGYEPSNHPPWE